MNPIGNNIPFFPEPCPKDDKISQRINAFIPPKDPQIPLPDVLIKRNINPINYEHILKENLGKFIVQTEKLEKSSKNKATLMKVLFVSLLILGIVCAASFFLMPILGNISALLSLSVAATTIAWQVIFLGGGLIAGLSALPRKFSKSFEENQNQYHEKAQILKQLALQNDFKNFLAAELVGKYRHTETIAALPDFAELYYHIQNINEKKLEIQRFERELNKIENLLLAIENPVINGDKKQQDIEEKINKVRKKIQKMHREVHELENEANDLRSDLSDHDRKAGEE